MILKNIGYKCEFDPGNPIQFKIDIETVKQKSKTIEIALKEKEYEYETFLSEYSGKELTENDFIRTLVELSSFMGFRINPSEITVSEYLAIRHKYEKEAEIQEQTRQKIKR